MSATAWIALVALVFTGTQAWIARRKLQFDLFAKRFETWDAFNAAVNGRCDEIREGARSGDMTTEDKYQKEMWRQKRLMVVLFPPEVHRSIEALDSCLMEFMVRSVDAATHDVGTPEAGQRAVARYQALQDANQKLWAAQGMLSGLVHPFLKQYGWWEAEGVPALRWLQTQGRRLKDRIRASRRDNG